MKRHIMRILIPLLLMIPAPVFATALNVNLDGLVTSNNTPILSVEVDDISDITYDWGYGNISGCAHCRHYKTKYGEFANSSDTSLIAAWHANEDWYDRLRDDSGQGNDGVFSNPWGFWRSYGKSPYAYNGIVSFDDVCKYNDTLYLFVQSVENSSTQDSSDMFFLNATWLDENGNVVRNDIIDTVPGPDGIIADPQCYFFNNTFYVAVSRYYGNETVDRNGSVTVYYEDPFFSGNWYVVVDTFNATGHPYSFLTPDLFEFNGSLMIVGFYGDERSAGNTPTYTNLSFFNVSAKNFYSFYNDSRWYMSTPRVAKINGTYYIVFYNATEDASGFYASIVMTTTTDLKNFSEPVCVDCNGYSSQSKWPSIEIMPNGDFLVPYASNPGSGEDIMYRTSSDHSTFSPYYVMANGGLYEQYAYATFDEKNRTMYFYNRLDSGASTQEKMLKWNRTHWFGVYGYGITVNGWHPRLQSVNITSFSNPPTSAFSVSLWFYVRSFTSDTKQQILKAGDGNWDGISVLVNSTGSLWCGAGNANTNEWADVETTDGYIQTEKWYHVVCMYDGTNVLLYVNGNLYGTSSATLSSVNYPGSMWFLGQYYDGSRRFDGVIDEVLVFNRTLTSSEIQRLWTGGSLSEGTYSVKVYASGTWGSNSTTVTFTVDRTNFYGPGVTHTVFSNGTVIREDTRQPRLNFTARPNQDNITVEILTWTSRSKKWNETAVTLVNVTHEVGDLPASTDMLVRKNGVDWITLTSNSSGWISFDYTDGTYPVEFEVVQTNSPPRFSENTYFQSSPSYPSTVDFQINWTDTDGNLVNISFQLGRPDGTVKNYTIPDGLVLHFTFDSVNSTNYTYDSSGYGHHGQLKDTNTTNDDGNTVPQLVPGKFGNALNFDGVDDVVDAGGGYNLSSDSGITIAAWIRPKSDVAARWLDKGTYSTNTGEIFEWNTQKFAFWVGNGTDSVKVWSSALPLNKYYFVVGVFDGRYVKVYIDGRLNATGDFGTQTRIEEETSNTLEIGGEGTLSAFNGTIDEVMIFNRSLTDAEIRELYSSLYPKFYSGDDRLNGIWYINFTQDRLGSAGGYNYTWYATDNAGAGNKTDTVSFTINKGTPVLRIIGNGTYTYPYTSNITGSENNTGDSDLTYNLYRNGTLVNNPDIAELPAGTYEYVFNTSGGQNWTSASVTAILTINKGTPVLNLTLNGYSNVTGVNNLTVNATGTAYYYSVQSISFSLLLDDSVLASGGNLSNITNLGPGEHNFTYYTSGNQNYTSASVSAFALVFNVTEMMPKQNSTLKISGPGNYSVFWNAEISFKNPGSREEAVNYTYTVPDIYEPENISVLSSSGQLTNFTLSGLNVTWRSDLVPPHSSLSNYILWSCPRCVNETEEVVTQNSTYFEKTVTVASKFSGITVSEIVIDLPNNYSTSDFEVKVYKDGTDVTSYSTVYSSGGFYDNVSYGPFGLSDVLLTVKIIPATATQQPAQETESSTGSGSSGGGGATLGGGTIKPKINGTILIFEHMKKMVPEIREVSVGPLRSVTVTPADDLPLFKLIIVYLPGNPVSKEPKGEPYVFMNITPEPSEKLDNVNFLFTVPSSWLSGKDPESVRLERFVNGTWIPLPTVLISTDEEYVYRSELPGFSYFVITAKKLEEKTQPSKKEEKPKENKTAPVMVKERPSDTGKELKWVLVAIVIIVVIVSIIIRNVLKRRTEFRKKRRVRRIRII